MGSYMVIDEGEFTMEQANLAKALGAARVLVETHDFWEGWRAFTSLDQGFDALSLYPSYDAHGNIVDLAADGGKVNGQHAFFSAIAPYVVGSSYLRCHDDNGQYWLWTFDGARLRSFRCVPVIGGVRKREELDYAPAYDRPARQRFAL